MSRCRRVDGCRCKQKHSQRRPSEIAGLCVCVCVCGGGGGGGGLFCTVCATQCVQTASVCARADGA